MDATVTAESETMLERLLAADIVGPADGDDELEVTETFSHRVGQWRDTVESLDESELRDELHQVTTDRDETETVLDLVSIDTESVATYLTLAHSDVADFSHVERLHILTVLDSIDRSPPPSRGAPETFLPVHGERLPFLLRLYRKAVVYVWLDECDDCDDMKVALDAVVDDYADRVALFSVYGPDCADLLREEYGVPGGPATLFFLDGDVDARLYGAHYQEVVRSEVETLIEVD